MQRHEIFPFSLFHVPIKRTCCKVVSFGESCVWNHFEYFSSENILFCRGSITWYILTGIPCSSQRVCSAFRSTCQKLEFCLILSLLSAVQILCLDPEGCSVAFRKRGMVSQVKRPLVVSKVSHGLLTAAVAAALKVVTSTESHTSIPDFLNQILHFI